MRAVFVGAGTTTVATAQLLLRRGHEVVVIEKSKERIDALSGVLDCGFLHGDGGKPAILREADAEHTDVLYCLTNDDQANILASLVGRSLEFRRVITKVEDPELVHICIELGLKDVIIPSHTIARHLGEIFEGHDPLEISARIRGDARIFSFIVARADAGPLEQLELPEHTRVICLYRGDKWLLPAQDTTLAADDEVILITAARNLEALTERWAREPANTR
jgi:trk system potassium uptake protein TrkA